MSRLEATTVAGRYVLVDPIGAGGMGSVWRAYDVRTQRWVAAKVLAATDSAALLRFVGEQGVRIVHPHVVAPTSWAAEDASVLFAMDLVRGGTLADLRAEHGPLPLDFVVVLLDQLLAALAAVHAAGVVHRDVKPANLLLEVTGSGLPHLRLADFGVAAVATSSCPGTVGTDGYLPPEQALGAPPEPRADLYAAGRVAERMLSTRQAEPIAPLLAALTAADPGLRPPSARQARRMLRQHRPPPGRAPRSRQWPTVTDRLGDAQLDVRRALALDLPRRRRAPRFWW
ncbi:MAG: serine/threonine-protein kinase [Nocardioides sp.]|uniref:serine/threonine-protein kinase n=1 Tax=Nocardioides sp. TaxID=35761 RepID=UPI0039E38A40